VIRSLTVGVVIACLVGCGAKTGLRGEDFDAGPGLDAPLDTPDARIFADVRRDVLPGVDAPLCTSDAECDDGASCTDDVCVDGLCTSMGQDERCDDGLFCDGIERCRPTSAGRDERGCVAGLAIVCSDAVACTVDACDEALDACGSTPEVALCPISHRCDPMVGCVARALAHDVSDLYEIDLPSGELRRLAPLPVALTDLALHPDGRLFGAAGGALWQVDYEAGTATMAVSIPGTSFNALDFSLGGELFGAVDDRIVRIDEVSGTSSTVVRFPSGLTTSGDVAFIGDRLYATVTADPFGTRPDILVEVDVFARTARIVNAVGERCVWGLAPFGETLYGLTCEGLLIRIDTGTGRSTRLRTGLARFYGAGAR
jgi:hypothetical protein